jgi:DNA-binding CsgD family transcriptional regulator
MPPSTSERRMNDRLHLLEAFYRFDLDERDHIGAIQEAAASHWEQRRPVAMMTSRSTPRTGFQTEFYISRGDRSDYVTAARGILPQMSKTEMLQYLSTVDFYGGTSEARQQGQFDSRGSLQMFERVGICDVVGFCCGTGEGGVVTLVALSRTPVATTPRERAYWCPVASHLAAAWRLRQRLSAGSQVEDLADAVFLPDGRWAGAPRGQPNDAMLGRLRYAIRAREAERVTRTTRDQLWSELIDGRWTLIDRFDADGRRFVVALRNTPLGANLCRLNQREVDALALARDGASNKVISITLGIAPATATRLLQSAATKLNAGLADILQFERADGRRCREMLLGSSQIRAHEQASDASRSLLSEAELEIVTAVLRGHSNQEIAATRGRSTRTVINQLASVYEKLGIHSRRELVIRCGGEASPAA